MEVNLLNYFRQVDDVTWQILIELPGQHIVLFKALLDSYEGVATSRTVDTDQYTVSVFTTTDMREECARALLSIRDIVPWRAMERAI